jgi:DNA-binding NarL/FixJ family response regulator
MRVFIAVKGRLLRDAIVLGLGHMGIVDVIGTVEGENPIQMIEESQPQVVLIDSALINAVALAEAIRERAPTVRIVVLAAVGSDEDFLAWARIGISGYVEPNTSIEDLSETLSRSGVGEVLCAPRLTGLLLERFASLANAQTSTQASHGLTTREREILKLLEEGCSNKVIARRLGISNPTVKNHVHNILGKLGVENRGQAASRFRQDVGPIERDSHLDGAPRRIGGDIAPKYAWRVKGATAPGL